jgi:thiamine transport system permease protein
MASWEPLATTALIALASAVASLAVGYPLGYWLATLRRLRRVVTGVLLVPFLLPAFLVGLAIRPLLGDALASEGFAVIAIIGAHVVMNAGFLAIVTAASLTSRDQYEAALLDGATERQIRWRVQWPQQLPALSAAALLVALYSATSYGLVITLGGGSVETLETQIARAALQNLDLPVAATLAGLQTLLTLGFFLAARRAGATPTVLFGEGDAFAGTSRWGGVVGFGVIGIIVWIIGGVFARAMLAGGGLFENIANLAGRGTRDILNLSVAEALGNSLRTLLIAATLSLVMAWLLSRRRVGLLVLLPIGISPVVFGLAALVISGYLPLGIAGSWLLLPLVQAVFLTPLAFQVLAPARRALSSDILEAAALDGAGRGQTLWHIELPSLAKPLAVATALVSVASLGEFGAASFLAYGSQETLPLVMFRLMSRPGGDNLGMAMAAASLFILVAFAVVWAVSSLRENTAVPEESTRV